MHISVGTGFLVLIHIILYCSACQSIKSGLSVSRTCWAAWLDLSLPPHRDCLLIHFILVIEISPFTTLSYPSPLSPFKIRIVWAPCHTSWFANPVWWELVKMELFFCSMYWKCWITLVEKGKLLHSFFKHIFTFHIWYFYTAYVEYILCILY